MPPGGISFSAVGTVGNECAIANGRAISGIPCNGGAAYPVCQSICQPQKCNSIDHGSAEPSGPPYVLGINYV